MYSWKLRLVQKEENRDGSVGKGSKSAEGEIHEIHYLARGGSRLVLIQRASQQRQLVGNLRV